MPSTTLNPDSSGSPITDYPTSADINSNDFPEHDNHQQPEIAPGKKKYQPHLNGIPCNEYEQDLLPNTPLPLSLPQNQNLWAPFKDKVQFRIANFLFQKVEMSQGDVNHLIELWNLSMLEHDVFGPFQNHNDMYKAIDEIPLGSAPWKCFVCLPDPDLPPSTPDWQHQSYQVWYCDPTMVITNMLANPDFTKIYEADPTTDGAMLVPIILGSNKTTVSVATSNVKYHPAYIFIGNILNHARHGHRNTVMPFVFLAIPKSDWKYDNDVQFCNFKHKLYHVSLAAILHSLKPGMTIPVVQHCPDSHFQRILYDLAAYIADYPEQVLLTGVVSGWCAKYTAMALDLATPAEFSGDSGLLWDNYSIDDEIWPFTSEFPCADIHEMLTSDLLHQIIKGSFKDHLIEWVGEYFEMAVGAAQAKEIMDDIDRC
ncbi:hypothetical protein IW262DRAFT_1451309 [Armillaria fumosa]|nr:hypothetical protein IW262DRAFT_1451309 [Armillaria fumosa]